MYKNVALKQKVTNALLSQIIHINETSSIVWIQLIRCLNIAEQELDCCRNVQLLSRRRDCTRGTTRTVLPFGTITWTAAQSLTNLSVKQKLFCTCLLCPRPSYEGHYEMAGVCLSFRPSVCLSRAST